MDNQNNNNRDSNELYSNKNPENQENFINAPLRPSFLRTSDGPSNNLNNRYTNIGTMMDFNLKANEQVISDEIEDLNKVEDLTKNKIFGDFKILFLGNCGVGKTSIIQRFVYNKFNKCEEATIGNEQTKKLLKIDQKTVINLSLVDTMGAERYSIVPKQMYKEAHGVIIVYDITENGSFEKLVDWVKSVKDSCLSDIVITVVGNKLDLSFSRTVSTTDGAIFAENCNASFFEVSAQSGVNIDLLFEDIANRIISSQKKMTFKEKVDINRERKSVGLAVLQKRKKGCC